MSLWLEVVRNKLITDGVATDSSGSFPCYIGMHPDTPDNSMSLVLTGGLPQETMGNENLNESFQLKVRTTRLDYSTLEQKCRDAFDSLSDADLSADDIYLIQATASAPLTWHDGKERVFGSLNFKVVRAKP
jgi:hypothetical protein